MTTAEILAAATPRPWKSTGNDMGETGDSFRWEIVSDHRNAMRWTAQTQVRIDADLIAVAVNAYERDQRVITALSKALTALLDDDVANRNMARKDVLAARAALALAEEAQGG